MTESTTTAWFHEDDYCQIELLPRAAGDFARRQAAQIEAFSSAHRDGPGWTDIFVRSNPPVALRELNIHIDHLGESVPPSFQRFPNVTTGYSSYVEPVERALAWGSGSTPLVFADYDSEGVVQHVWFASFAEDDHDDVRTFLARCGERWALVLADWAWRRVVDLSDPEAIAAYLTDRTGSGEV